jgi:hypothetical protein
MAGGKFKKLLRKVAPGLLSLIPVVGPALGAVAGGVGKYLDEKDAAKAQAGAAAQNPAMAQGIASVPQAAQFSEVTNQAYNPRPVAQGNLYEASVSPLAQQQQQPAGIGGLPSARPAVPYEMFGPGPEPEGMAYGGPVYMAYGGLAGIAPQQYAAGGRFLSGPGDGTSDSIRANIEGKQEARLADGEFVLPADIVSHIGNGSSKAGAEKLYAMMDNIRRARTGTAKMGKTIKADKYLPA